MIHRRTRRTFLNRLPPIAFQVVSESQQRRLRGLAVESDSIEFIDLVSAASKINSLISFRDAGGNSILRYTRMSRQLGPLDLAWVFFVNLSNPTLIRSGECRLARAGYRTARVHDAVVQDAARMP